jgi:hypothetical protein
MVEKRVNDELAAQQVKWQAENNQRVNYLEAVLRQQKSSNRNGGNLLAKGPRTSNRNNPARNELVRADAPDPFSTREERGVPHLTDLLDAVNTPQ